MNNIEYFVNFAGILQLEENMNNKIELNMEDLATEKADVNLDSSLKDIEQIKNISVNDLYKICEISMSMPISFDKLLKHFKIKIMGTDFNFISKFEEVKKQLKGHGLVLGMVNIEDGYANIYYNNNSEIDIPRQRFTIAHELAHCINHYDILSKCGQVEFLEDETEAEDIQNIDTINKDMQEKYLREYVCNKFARDFLIPTDLLKKVIGIINKVSVPDLAELFMVPEKEMQIKLKEIGY